MNRMIFDSLIIHLIYQCIQWIQELLSSGKLMTLFNNSWILLCITIEKTLIAIVLITIKVVKHFVIFLIVQRVLHI